MVRTVLLLSQNLIVSSFTKIQYLFWYWLIQVVLEKRLLGIFRIFFLGCACIQGRLNQWAHRARTQGPRISFFFEGPPLAVVK